MLMSVFGTCTAGVKTQHVLGVGASRESFISQCVLQHLLSRLVKQVVQSTRKHSTQSAGWDSAHRKQSAWPCPCSPALHTSSPKAGRTKRRSWTSGSGMEDILRLRVVLGKADSCTLFGQCRSFGKTPRVLLNIRQALQNTGWWKKKKVRAIR